MKTLIDGQIYVAPNGVTKLKIYPHGFIEPVGEISREDGDIIKDMSQMAVEILGRNATPYQIFEFMGWTKEHLNENPTP